ncbi:hypothetical protein [Phenylobacterium montanum]|uniref:Uncharacterized protein n=1 Tax=Phenylobacterium montanum TaxID=2823693 RepID=A0A975G2D0_9CAUL|nr:hypothetical protein [Caulobacter sp. S6]QUD89863.1 hypothetical protein KCG34_08330 [Caulobacter sp. S6]
MILAGLAALAIGSSGDPEIDGMLARIHSTKEAYENCLFSQAVEMHPSRDSQALEQKLLARCSSDREAWLDAMTVHASPKANAAARAAVEPMFPTLASLAIQAAIQQGRQCAAIPTGPGPITRHVEPPRSTSASSRDRAVTPARPPGPTGPCGGITVPTDPSALTCRN